MDIFYPLQLLADWLVFDLVRLGPDSHLGFAVNYFIYDSLKIVGLLLAVNYLMAAFRHYLPVEKLRDFLASRKWYGFDYLLGASFGTLTPFCSCSSIPLFVGFLGAGIPLGVTLSFLITSPLVNQVAVVLFGGLFGWKITVLYVAAAVALGVVGGFILGKLKLEKYVADYVWQIKSQGSRVDQDTRPISGLLKLFWQEGWALTKKITPYVLLGVGVGALIHGYVPAVIVAVPMYANAVGVIPIVQSLVEKGIPLGTAMAFMMAVVGLSLPEALILKKVMRIRLLAYFFGITTVNIIIIGYLFNAFTG
jgi:uncharacterized protein